MNAYKAKVLAGWVLSIAIVATVVAIIISLAQHNII